MVNRIADPGVLLGGLLVQAAGGAGRGGCRGCLEGFRDTQAKPSQSEKVAATGETCGDERGAGCGVTLTVWHGEARTGPLLVRNGLDYIAWPPGPGCGTHGVASLHETTDDVAVGARSDSRWTGIKMPSLGSSLDYASLDSLPDSSACIVGQMWDRVRA